MKKIAVDLDGVVFDSETLYRVYTEMYDADVKKQDTLVDNTQRLFQKRYNWSAEEFSQLYNDISNKVLTESNFMTGVDIILNKLKEDFELIIVTSRSDVETKIAIDRLKTIGIENIKIFNNEHHKIDRFLSENVDYIIDDDPDICINASNQNITALYFKNNAANKVDKDKVINVNNWGEIYKYLILNKEG